MLIRAARPLALELSPIRAWIMTEREKMLAGEMYDPVEPALVVARQRARDLCQLLNATTESQQQERCRILGFTLIGPVVPIYTPMHPLDAEQLRQREFGKPVDIGSDLWIGGGAILLPGVRIGSFAVIGAGSVVTRNVPEGAFAAGKSCRVIRQIQDDGGETHYGTV
jgi:maltose O-acetyltransferase